MVTDGRQTEALIERALRGDEAALGELFSHYRPQLEIMLLLRMGRRRRLDTSEVLRAREKRRQDFFPRRQFGYEKRRTANRW